jgi:hypothetical protein
MVISRGRFLASDPNYVFDAIAQVKQACGDVRETLGEDWMSSDVFRVGANRQAK